MLKRNLKKSEIAIILLLTVLLLGLLYYQFVWKVQKEHELSYDSTSLQDQMMIQQSIAASITKMEEEIEENKGGTTGMVASYNNLSEEIKTLNDIFGETDSFSFSFAQAQTDGTAVRRVINASFVADSYEKAEKMLKQLSENPYRCLIRSLSFTPTGERESSILNAGPVAVSFSVTFYETMYNATTTNGLAAEQD